MESGQARIYLDYNATTPVDPEVVATVAETMKSAWGNPSSSYPEGRLAKHVISKSRKQVADSISADASEIVFVSGGTEANNWVILSAIEHFKNSTGCMKIENNMKCHVVSTTVEHDAILLPLAELQKKGIIDVTLVAVDKKAGSITANSVAAAVRWNTCLVTVMMANNETGTIMPIQQICDLIHQGESSQRPLIHTDAAQALGKIPVDVKALKVDCMTLVGHKFYGPRTGVLFARGLGHSDGVLLHKIFHGGAQERGYRPGTENTPMIAGLGKAAAIACENLEEFSKNMEKTRDYLEKRLAEEFGSRVLFNCRKASRLPNTCNVSFVGEKLEGYKLLRRIQGFSCSTGSACHSDECKPSQILLNFNVPFDAAMNAIRISTGRYTTLEDIDCVIAELKEIVLCGT